MQPILFQHLTDYHRLVPHLNDVAMVGAILDMIEQYTNPRAQQIRRQSMLLLFFKLVRSKWTQTTAHAY